MKKLLFVFIIMTFFLNSLFVHASDIKNEKIKASYDSNLLSNIPEKTEVVNAFEKDRENLLKGAEDFTQKKNVKLDPINSFKVFVPKSVDILSEYKSGKKFKDLISVEDSFYAFPIAKDDENIGVILMTKYKKVDEKALKERGLSDETIKMCKEKEGKIGMALTLPISETSGYKVFTDPGKIEEILVENNITDITEIKFVSVFSLHLDLLYIATKNGEFGIPFADRPEFLNVKNGCLYNMDELINIFKLDKNANSGSLIQAGGVTAGILSKASGTSQNNLNSIRCFIAISIVFFIIGIIVYISKRINRISSIKK